MGLVDRWTLLLSQDPCQRRDEDMRRSWLVDQFTVSAVTVNFAITAVQHERDISLFQDRANFRGVVCLKPVVENCRGKLRVSGINTSCWESMS